MKSKNYTFSLNLITLGLLFTLGSFTAQAQQVKNDEASADLDMRLRYESVDQDNALKDASALTLRTRLTFTTASKNGFSAVLDFEDSRSVFGVNDFNNTNGLNTNYSVIADPETTEVDQAYVQYKADNFTAKLGRQVITMDGHRFVGHVGWRQDRQTFDGLSVVYKPASEMTLKYSYVNKRNRIFAEQKDIDSNDHFLNAAYKTSLGVVSAYGYLLEVDAIQSNSLDTYGISFVGSHESEGFKLLYAGEYASQSSSTATTDFDAAYTMVEVGTAVQGITVKLGAESLGSDGGQYGFQTPLATLHKFNGWADQFLATPNQGLQDLYLSVAGKAFGGGWMVVYHDFSADEDTTTPEVSDLGSEIDLQYSKKIAKNYLAGIKYAAYSAGDSAAGKVDTNKLWLWLNAKF